MALVVLAAAQVTAADQEPLTDQKFVAKAVECAMVEVKAAELAQQRAANKEVKDFAQLLLDDHSKCRKQLMDETADLKLAVVEGFDKDSKQQLDRLAKLEGKDFDQAYMQGVIERHEKALRSMEAQAKGTTHAKLKACLAKATPILQGHLEKARQLQAKIK